jgi:hypothetical protein
MSNGQYSFFDLEHPLDKIYQLNDFLPKLTALIYWEIFCPDLNKVHEKERRFHAELDRQGFAAKNGSIVDSSFVEVPKQRNTREENEQIKQGEIPDTLDMLHNRHPRVGGGLDVKGYPSFSGFPPSRE